MRDIEEREMHRCCIEMWAFAEAPEMDRPILIHRYEYEARYFPGDDKCDSTSHRFWVKAHEEAMEQFNNEIASKQTTTPTITIWKHDGIVELWNQSNFGDWLDQEV